MVSRPSHLITNPFMVPFMVQQLVHGPPLISRYGISSGSTIMSAMQYTPLPTYTPIVQQQTGHYVSGHGYLQQPSPSPIGNCQLKGADFLCITLLFQQGETYCRFIPIFSNLFSGSYECSLLRNEFYYLETYFTYSNWFHCGFIFSFST